MFSEQRSHRQPDLPRALADGNEAVTACGFECHRPDKARAPKLSERSSRSHVSGVREHVVADLRAGKDAGIAIAAQVHTSTLQRRRRKKERG
jgi:hypothetical protein